MLERSAKIMSGIKEIPDIIFGDRYRGHVGPVLKGFFALPCDISPVVQKLESHNCARNKMSANYICPQDRASLQRGPDELVTNLNRMVGECSLRTLYGMPFLDLIEELWVHPSGQHAYAVCDGVALLRQDQAIALSNITALPAYAELLNSLKKLTAEFDFWSGHMQGRVRERAEYVEPAYLEYFSNGLAYYDHKRILDLGCGPCGTLEWADQAAIRVGLDPLAYAYRQFGTARHKMQYVCAEAERIPFPDRYFDIVSSFNSLDHVDDLERVIAEIQRVITPGGRLLLLSDIHREPTPCEPITYGWDIVKRFKQLEIVREEHLEKIEDGVYSALKARQPFDHSCQDDRYGLIAAVLEKPLKRAAEPQSKLTRWDALSSEEDFIQALSTLSPPLRRMTERYCRQFWELQKKGAAVQEIQHLFAAILTEELRQRFHLSENSECFRATVMEFMLSNGTKLHRLAALFARDMAAKCGANNSL